MNVSDRLPYLIDRYIAGSCTRQEMNELLNYIQQHPEDERIKDMLPLPDAWEGERAYPGDAGLSWSDMQKRIQNVPLARGGRGREGVWWRLAACILLLMIAGGGFLAWRGFQEIQPTGGPLLTANAVETANGERRLIVLADGSKVWINGGSKIIEAHNFNKQTRKVTLYGEAFFDIRRDESRPFVIESGRVKTTVLGTAFNIRAFPEEREVTVTVARGKVMVEAENQKVSMVNADQQITLNLKSEEVISNPVNAAEVTRWIKDDLILHEVTLDEVEEVLEEYYAVDVVFDNVRLKECRFTSTFLKNATLEEVLAAVCLVNNATFEVENKLITIYGDGCPEQVAR